MLEQHARLTRQFAITIDVFTVSAAFVLSFYLRRVILFLIPFGSDVSLHDHISLLMVIPFIWWVLLNMQSAYTWQRFTSLKIEYRAVFRTTVFGTLILLAVFFIFRINKFPRSLIVLFAIVCFSLLILEKTLLYYTIGQMRRHGRNRKKVLVVGAGELAREFLSKTEDHPEWGLEVIGFLSSRSGDIGKETNHSVGLLVNGGRMLGSYEDLMLILHKQDVQEVVFAIPSEDLNTIREMLMLCEREGVDARLVSDFFHTMIAKLHIHEIYGMPILTFSAAPINEWQQFIKRCIDIIASAILLVVLNPLFLIIAALIKFTSRGPIFYKWNVVGFNKKSFRGYKFRSMVRDADKLKEKLLEQNEMTGIVFKLKNDPRVTFVGRFLRKFSLDELPQLWSVLKGDMSLVGPRPCLQTELPHFESWHRRKFSVKPGMTCLWQVNGRSNIKDFSEWVKMDLEYIDNWSLWLDFKILLKTVPAVLLWRGAS